MRKKTHRAEVILKHIGDAFRARRLDLLLSQDELAVRSDLHRTYITDVESGYRNISLLTFEKLTMALECALSFPLVEAERTMSEELRPKLSKLSGIGSALLPRDKKSFHQRLREISIATTVMANMAKLQLAIEKYATKHAGDYPKGKADLAIAILNHWPINPCSKIAELPSIGTFRSELTAMQAPPGKLRAGSIEYSPVSEGMNYILRGGTSGGTALPGRVPLTTYILSGNFRSDNQP